MERFQKLSNEVFYAKENILQLDCGVISSLKQCAQVNKSKKSRICTHLTELDAVHEMIIVHNQGYYVRPHRHFGKSESFHIVEGELDLLIFDENGNLHKIVEMGEYASGKAFYYRLSSSLFHSMLIKSASAVFHETTNGPFDPQDTEYASWSPDKNSENYMKQLLLDVNEFKQKQEVDGEK